VVSLLGGAKTLLRHKGGEHLAEAFGVRHDRLSLVQIATFGKRGRDELTNGESEGRCEGCEGRPGRADAGQCRPQGPARHR
jgi:hypothetical protein